MPQSRRVFVRICGQCSGADIYCRETLRQPPARCPADRGSKTWPACGCQFSSQLTNGKRDQDYNGGGAVTFSGERAGPIGRALDRALGFIDRTTCPHDRFTAPGWQASHAFAVGLLIFTPGDLAAEGVVYGDRPYASLFFLSAGRRYVSPEADVAYGSSLTFGMMGLEAARSVQHALHSLTGSVQPHGWSHQVSAGGEPTLRYSTARQALLSEFGRGTLHGDSKWTVAGSLGTVTEGSLAFSARWGRIESPWWAFTPEQTMYVQETQPIPAEGTARRKFAQPRMLAFKIAARSHPLPPEPPHQATYAD